MQTAILYQDGWYEGPPEHADPVGVLGIVYPDPCDNVMGVGTLTITGWDYYLLEGEDWVGVNGSVDLIDHVLHVRPRVVLKGRMVSRRKWQKAVDELRDYPQKSATVPGFEEPRSPPEGTTR